MRRSLPFIYAAVELENALTERLQQALEAADLTSTQFHILYMLVEDRPLTMSALAEQQPIRASMRSPSRERTWAKRRTGLVG